MIDLINTIRIYSPKAWILNYSNPAAIVMKPQNDCFHMIIV